MNINEIVPFLQQTPLFGQLKQKEIKSIVEAATQKEYTSGSFILHEGDTGAGFYLILDGQVEISNPGGYGLGPEPGPGFFGQGCAVGASDRC